MVTNFKLFERKNLGILYHFTTISCLEQILEQDLIKSETEYISFTRTKNPYNLIGRKYREIRIVLDGNKLSDNYKIEPYNDFPDNNDFPKIDETEERIVLLPKHKINNYFVIKNIKKYIIKIDISISWDSNCKNLIEKLKDNNPDIEINLVKKW